MKKKLIIGVAILSMAISFVGCSSANDSNKTSTENEPYIEIAISKPYENSDYYVELIGVSFHSHEPDFVMPEEYEEKMMTIHSLNNEISDVYFTEGEIYIAPTNIELTGEIKDGKTYFYYDGYVTTLDGETKDFNEVLVCDFELEPEIFNFRLDD